MDPRDVITAEQARAIVEQRGLDHVKVGIFDMDGVLRGKYMAREKFFSALKNGFGFCDVVVGWDSYDQLYDNVEITGWHTGYPDAQVRILPGSCREIPWEEDMLLFLGEFAGEHEAVCPRAVLRRTLDKAEAMGFQVLAGFEYEFFVFEETPHSVREKNYRNMNPMQPGFFGYSMLRNTVESDFYRDLLEGCADMDMPLEGLHEETGPGVLEAALSADTGLNAADKAALFKTFTKIMAQKTGMMATFMAKWSADWPGQSGHIHMSLKDRAGGAVFYDEAAKGNMSPTMRHFVGGQQKLMPETLAMIASTVNSYTRLVPGFWAPTDSNWGIDTAPARSAWCPARPRRSGSSTGSPPPTPTRISPWPRRWAPGSGASRTKSSRTPPSTATPTTENIRNACNCRPPYGRRRAACGPRSRPGRCSAMPSSITSPPAGSGRNASSASTSPTGKWNAISRSSDLRMTRPSGGAMS